MRWLGVLLAGMLGGCALLPSTPVPAMRPAQPEAAPFALNGRIAVKYNGSRHSAGLRWTHTAQSDEILLLAPLGQTAARVYRDAQSATLDDGDKHYQAVNTEALMQQVLGWYLPLSGLHHWVLGLPEAGSPAQIERNGNGQIAVLRQGSWEVHYQRYPDDRPDSLPTRLQLSREGLQVQLLIDEWELP
ncbi:lipoprotein insertase outer membrane protein LolB [Candidatus Ferrigenium straubiae]|jgi:outer membrane lipoprotein LolB|uniref:lipoprotein insertase outer membrane protein LolB n=1 Tax=Candidatus Ferrigenium straubiae TaxID=2919506 RepID=UPI003F4AF2FD